MGDENRLSELEESVRQLGTKVEEQETALTEEKEQREAAETRAERAEDALLLNRAEAIVHEALVAEPEEGEERKVPQLPARALKRAQEAVLSKKLPVDEDGKLDKERLVESAITAAKEEAEYLTGASGNGTVTGFGESATPPLGNNNDDAGEEELGESFKRLGMSEETAKHAVRGR